MPVYGDFPQSYDWLKLLETCFTTFCRFHYSWCFWSIWYAWHILCSSFGRASVSLCDSLAAVARCLCTQEVYAKKFMAFVACWLNIPLDKKPVVQPVGIGDVSRRTIAKAILYVIRTDIQLAVGALQMYDDHDAEAEAAIERYICR